MAASEDGREIYDRLMSRVITDMNNGGDGYSILTPAERRLVAFEELRDYVNSDGFDNYFFYTAGDLAMDAITVAREMGETELADMIERVIALYFGKQGYSGDIDIRQEIIDSASDQVGAEVHQIDLAYYDLEARRNLDAVSNELASHVQPPPA